MRNANVKYMPAFMDAPSSQRALRVIQSEVCWRRTHGNRKTCFMAEDQSWGYTYKSLQRDVKHRAQPWTPQILLLKRSVEAALQKISGCSVSFNSVLLNLYETEHDGIHWHSDTEESLVVGAPIASLSLGASREMQFRSINSMSESTIRKLPLRSGTLMCMMGDTQLHWQHAVLPLSKGGCGEPGVRINLTFRVSHRPEYQEGLVTQPGAGVDMSSPPVENPWASMTSDLHTRSEQVLAAEVAKRQSEVKRALDE